MINWRNGKAGFVGGLKYAIKGFFKYAHSVTSETAVTPEVVASAQFKIDFPPQDRNVNFAFEDRNIVFPYESRDIKK